MKKLIPYILTGAAILVVTALTVVRADSPSIPQDAQYRDNLANDPVSNIHGCQVQCAGTSSNAYCADAGFVVRTRTLSNTDPNNITVLIGGGEVYDGGSGFKLLAGQAVSIQPDTQSGTALPSKCNSADGGATISVLEGG